MQRYLMLTDGVEQPAVSGECFVSENSRKWLYGDSNRRGQRYDDI